MITHPIDRDERTESVENASYRWAYYVLSFGVLASVAYRGVARHENAWDLLALVVAAGTVPVVYQALKHVLSRRTATTMILAALVAAVAAAIAVLLR